uniref:Uncharacterized protein n=1 Tax=Siphoviridae sp. ctEqU3 TaxID=2825399 RepID=A0A8S5P150_9CAUD|nr:MAG TPA: hypothetical protein [Siphoviridae sp. ctEqU3]
MSFDYSTLITNRARSDSDTLKTLLSKPMAEWTAEERTAFNTAVLKGSYDYTDLNRVDDCLEDLVARLNRVGCLVPRYERVKLPRETKPASRLPEGYTEVQYIQSTGTQYVDTGFKPSQDSRVLIKLSTSETGSHTVFGADLGWTDDGFALGVGFTHYGKETGTISGLNNGSPHEADFNKNIISMDGKPVLTMGNSTFSVPHNLALFANNRAGGIQEKATMVLYYCRIYDGNTIIRDYIPCKNAAGAVGLYDLIGQKFYGNAGTGSFTAGPVVTWEAPEEPTETLDPYTWYESDVPTASLLARYRANVAAVRAVLRLPEGTPEVPATLRRMTQAEANGIEAVLLAVDLILNHIPAAVRHCGVTVCGSKGVRA